MKSHLLSRLSIGAAFLVLCASVPAFARIQKNAPPPVLAKPARPAEQPRNTQVRSAQTNGPKGEQNPGHLGQWLENHKALSPADQRRALQNEPGFRELPAQTQQRELQQLDRLNAMNPQQRSRMLDRTEVLERMSPQQREQWRGAVQDLNALPQPRRRLMARAILDLREMPPDQRQRVIDSPAMRSEFSDGERSTLSTLLTAEPYNPATP